jgi:hypothetical protein
MPLRHFMTTTATVSRTPAVTSGKIGDPVEHLTQVKIQPITLPMGRGQNAIRAAIGFGEGSAIQVFETYTEAHGHYDGGVYVEQVPDIRAGDTLTSGGKSYSVRFAEQQSATSSFGATLIIYMTEDKRQ